MRRILIFSFVLPCVVFAQEYGFKKGTKGNDYLLVKNTGITFAIGPTWQLTPKTETYERMVGNSRGISRIDPAGKIGFYGEFGYVIFPKWKGLIPIKALKKTRLLDYMDMAIGYRQYRGIETTQIDFSNAQGVITSSSEGHGTYSNGLAFGRFDAHTLLYVGKKKIDKARKYFIDQSLGINVDYALLGKNKDYENTFGILKPQKFYNPLVIQLHYSLGYGIRLNRAWMLIPGVSLPVLNLSQWSGWNAKMNWFSSTYWPIQGQIRLIKMFERQPKCGAYGDPSDVEKNKGFQDKN